MAITNGWCRSARLLAVLLTGIALAGGSSAVRRSGGQRAGSASALTPLTELGQSCRTVVIASMLGGVCKADDWRGGLPRFVAQALPQADVFVWNARKKSDVENNICVTCKPLIVPALSNPESRGGVKRQGDHFDCQEMWGKANRTADVLIVVGTGSTFCEYERIHSLPCDAPQDPWENYLSLATVLRQPWLRQDTKTVHIPVRLLQPLNANVMGFDKVIPDNSFVKPLQDTSVNLMKSCGSRPRSNKLMYVARYGSGGKGQLEFLERVDPRLLQGYTVEFYGGNFSHTAAHELQETAQRRGISVLVHPAIPKTDLLLQICLSKGQIHYAYKDDNPRAAYEGIYAGNPLFVTYTSNIASQLFKESFVFGTDFQHPENMNEHFANFMQAVGRQDSKLQSSIQKYAHQVMTGPAVYLELCQRMGLCANDSSAIELKQRSTPGRSQ